MVERIKYLEKEALPLEPSPGRRRELLDNVVRYCDNFINNISNIPAFVVTDDGGKGIIDSPISEKGIDIDEIIRLIEYNLDRPGLNPASGGHLGYIPGGGIYFSALGDYIADIMNHYAGVFFAGPGAVRMENMMIDWMSDIVGYPKGNRGNLTSGGSIANLIGIVAARDAHNLKARDFERSAIYMTPQVHHSVKKAIRIAGLKESIIRYVPVDKQYRMNPDILQQFIISDKKEGLNPFLIVASAGTTDTGAVDPLEAIGRIADRYNLWFHIDGAYGAFFILCDEVKQILNGMKYSDSIVMDPHKGMFLPYGSGAILVKKGESLINTFQYEAHYMQDAFRGSDEVSPADISPELTKHFRGLRLWLPLKLIGIAPFRAALEEKILLSRYFFEQLKNIKGFELGPFPDLSVVTYRYLPKRGDPDEFNRRLVEEVQKDGRVFISSTILEEKYTLRLAVLAFRTHLKIIEETIDILKEKVKLIEGS